MMTPAAFHRLPSDAAATAFARRVLPFAVASCFALPAAANPGGASVAAGAASFSMDGKTLTVTNAPGTIINWQQFSIRPDEITRFVQSGAASAVLNRVTGGDPSQILGQLLSNGRVFLINPAGVTIGAGAVIDTAGFVASSLNIGDADFLSGRMRFSALGAAGKVENHGTIRASAGPVYLIAPTVENHGVIRAENGDILLAAGKRVELVAGASPHLRVELDNAEGASALNVGELVGRSVNLYGTALRNAGSIQATRVEVGEGGSIFLRAAKDVTLDASSRIDASGTKGGTVTVQAESGTLLAQGRIDAVGSSGKGGDVQLLGDRVGLLDGAAVDASGRTGGGTVLVGGDYQGTNAVVQNASRTYVDVNASVRADAVESGNGGTVVVWSNEATGFHGLGSARGGARSGDGGFVEVSGKQYLDYQGFVDTTAAMGATGTLLLDPSDIRITTTADAFAGGAFSGGAPRIFTGASGTATITWGTINTQLGASNVIINTGGTGGSGDITVVDASPALNRNNALWLVANRNITVNGAITNSGTGALGLYAGWNGAAFTFPTAPVVTAGTGTIALNQNVTLTSGAFTASAGGNVSGAGAIATAGGNNQGGGAVSITSSGGTVNLSGSITTSAGARTSNGVGPNAGSVLVSGASTTVGAITARGADGQGGNNAGGSGGAVTLIANGASGPALQLNGAIDTRGGNSVGTGTAGSGGAVILRANAGGTIAGAQNITTSGGRGQTGGAVTVQSTTPGTALMNSVSLAGTIDTSGGLGASSGRNGGAVSIADASVIALDRITTRGSAAATGNNVGGNGGAVSITTRGANASLQLNNAIDTRGGDSVGTGNTGAGGAVLITSAAGGSITGGAAATIDTTGGRGQTGGNVTVTAAGGNAATVNLQGAITTSGGAAATNLAGKNAGTVAVSNATAVTLAGPITARGSNAGGGNFAGGSGGAVNLDASGATPTMVIGGAIDTRGGASTGTGVGGTGGNVRLRTSNGGSVTAAGAINTSGGRGQNAGTVTVTTLTPATDTLASVNLQGAITATGGTGVTAGLAGGAVSVVNANQVQVAAITTRGSNAVGANLAGGNGGAVSITTRNAGNAITLNGAIDTRGGDSTGTGNTGNGGAVTLTGAAGGSITGAATATITTVGGRGQTGGNVTVTAAGGNAATVNLQGAITTSGGTAATGLGGKNAGTVAVNNATAVTLAGPITARGSNADGAANAAGGTGGAVNLDAAGTAPTMVIGGAIDTRGGDSAGTGTGGTGGNVRLRTGNGGSIVDTAAIITSGGRGQAAGTVTVTTITPASDTLASVNLQGAITAAGGAGVTAGLAGGAVSIANANQVQVAGIDTQGSNAVGANQVGGSGGAVSITTRNGGNAIVLNGAIVTSGGNSTGTGNTGSGGAVTLTGAAGGSIAGAAPAAITTTGGRGQTGGNVLVTAAGGNLATVDLQGAITTSGGTAATGLGGKNAGTVTVNNTAAAAVGTIAAQGSNAATGVGGAGGALSLTATTSTTLRGNVSTNGGTGTTTGGAGANVTVNGPSVLGASITVDTRGGTGGTTGAGGAVFFNGNMTSPPAGNDLTVLSGTGTIRFGGGVTDVRQLTTTSTAAAGTRFDGSVDTADAVGNRILVNGNVTIGGNVVLRTDNATNDGSIAITGTTNADAAASLRRLTLDAGDGTVDNGAGGALAAIGGTQALASFGAIGSTVRLGNVTANAGAPGGVLIEADNLASLGTVAMTGALTVRPHSAATNMRVGGAGVFAGLDLSGARLAAITGYNALVAGSATGQGAVSIGAGLPAFASGVGVTLQSGGTGGTVSIANPLTTTGAGGLTVSAGTGGAALGANVTVGGTANLASTGNGIVQTAGAFVAPGTTTLNATGANNDVTLTQAGNDFGTVTVTAARNVSLRDANSVTLGAANLGGSLGVRTALDITLAGIQSASAGILLEAGRNFINTAGAAALDPGAGRWLVYSTNPASDTRGGLVYAFKQYNAPIGTAPLGAGNGFLYSVAPVVTPALVPTVSKVYDGTTAATLVPANYAVTGAIDGDTVTLNNPAAGTYDTRNVGTGKTVTVDGIAIAGAANGAATVYGYQLAAATASGNVGTITARPLTVSSSAGQGKVYGTNDPASAATAYGVTSGSLASGDTLSGSMGRLPGETVGSRAFTQNTVTVADGNGGNNYALTFNGAANPFAITAASLTASIANQSKTYGANDPALGGIPVTLTGLVNTTVTDINGASTVINDSALSSTVTALTRNAGENVGSYAITAGTFAAPSANYSAPGLAGSPTLDITQANLTASIASQSKVYGTPDPALAGIPVSLAGIVNRTVSTWNGSVPVDDTGLVGASLASLARVPGENVGAYAYTSGVLDPLNGASAGNYAAVFLPGASVLDITPAALVIAANNANRFYGDPNPPFSATFTGLANGDTPAAITGLAFTTPALVTSSPGAYAITPLGAANPNYVITYANGTLAIAAAPLTIRASDASRFFGQPNPPFSATYTGFRLGQGPGDLVGTLALATPAVPQSPPGTYPIVPSGVSSLNYAVTFVDGVLSIAGAAPANAEQARDVALQRSVTLPAMSRQAGGCATDSDDRPMAELAPGLCIERVAR